MSYREVIEDSLKKIWKKKEIDDFFQLLEKAFPFEKKVSLGYYINEIIEKEPFINKYKILEYTNRMEKYKNSYEFLENLFSLNEKNKIILESIKEDKNKIENLMGQLVKKKVIELVRGSKEIFIWIK